MEPLFQHIEKFTSCSDLLKQALLQTGQIKSFGPKQFILEAGTLCKHRYFVQEGCIRSVFINKKGTEQTLNFAIENWWITDLDSIHNNTFSKLYLQTTENTKVVAFENKAIESILEKHPLLEKYFRTIAEKVKIADQKRIEYMFTLSGKELYAHFCQLNPGFVQRIPQYMLASYLGFTPEFLSKIRNPKHH